MKYTHMSLLATSHWPLSRLNKERTIDAYTGWIALIVTTLSTSTFNGYAKVLTTALSSLSLLFVSEVLTAFFILFSFGFLPVIRHFWRLQRRDIRPLITVGLLNGVAAPIMLFAGLSYTSAVNAGFYSNMQMVFMVLLATMILREKMTSARSSAIITIIAGTVFISLRGFQVGLNLQYGDFLILASSLTYAFASIFYRKYLAHIEPHVALFTRSIIAITLFFVVSPFVPHPFITEIQEFPMALIPALIGFGFIGRFLNSVTYYVAIEKLELTTVSLFGSLSIIFSTLFAYYYLGEPIEWFHYVGGAFIILGTVLLEVVGSHPSNDHLELHMKQRLP